MQEPRQPDPDGQLPDGQLPDGQAPDGRLPVGGAPGGQDALARALALGVLRDASLGDRLVVRARHGDGAQDALGTLVARTADTLTIETRRGPVEVLLADVVAAKPVPPPPAPRPRRR